MYHHCAIDVEGILRNHKKPGSLDGLFKDDAGRPVPDEVVRNYLWKCRLEGKRVIPGSTKCDNFDYEHGCCLGHPDKEVQP